MKPHLNTSLSKHSFFTNKPLPFNVKIHYFHTKHHCFISKPSKTLYFTLTNSSKSSDDIPTQSLPSPPAIAMRTLLNRINDCTKWMVSAIAFAYLLFNRDLLSCWCIFGAVAASLVNRLVKYTLNHQRPHTSKKSDPGMPSAHANSLAYLSTFCALASSSQPLSEPLGLLLVFGVPSIAIYLAWLRVVLGYHTIPQVAVGWVVGSAVASGWWLLGSRKIIPYLVATADPLYSGVLYGLTVVAVMVFSYTNVRRWWFEEKTKTS